MFIHGPQVSEYASRARGSSSAGSSGSHNGSAGAVMLCKDSHNSLIYGDCRRHCIDTIAVGKGYIDFQEALKTCRTGAEANLRVNTDLANCRSITEIFYM
jgi:hypothetical protein